jgi:hypothetical protein
MATSMSAKRGDDALTRRGGCSMATIAKMKILSDLRVIIAFGVLAIQKPITNGNVYYGCSVQRYFTLRRCHHGHIMYISQPLTHLPGYRRAISFVDICVGTAGGYYDYRFSLVLIPEEQAKVQCLWMLGSCTLLRNRWRQHPLGWAN